jgi:hypothetical protein
MTDPMSDPMSDPVPDPYEPRTYPPVPVDEVPAELTAAELRVLADGRRVVPVWGWWGLGIAVVALLATLVTRGAGERGESIAHIRSAGTQYQGRSLKIRGRVGDVFQMGGSHVYYLLQSRDTMVVFTHGVAPRSGATISVEGTLSIGYLDGAPRPALFATGP